MGTAVKPTPSRKSKEEADMSEVGGSNAGACEGEAMDAASCTSRVADAAGEDQFLCITVREARNLVAKDYETASSDPFAKVTLGPHIRKSRIIYRNRHPMWQQRLLFPLDSLDEGEPLLVELWDKDFAGIEFLGQVIMTLGKALEIAQDAATGRAYWFPLAKKRSTDIVGGELCLGFEVLDAMAFTQVVSEVEDEMDPDSIAASLEQRALHIQLHGLNGLKANNMVLAPARGEGAPSLAVASPRGGGGGKGKVGPRARSLFIRYGRFCLEKPLPAEFDENGGEFEVPINEEVLIPLGPALKLGSLASRRKDELHDLKIYIKGSTHTIAKTQIPIWDIPIEDSPPMLSPIADETDSDRSAESAAPSPAAAAPTAASPAASPTAASGRVTPPSVVGPASGKGSGRVTPPLVAAMARSISGRLASPLGVTGVTGGGPGDEQVAAGAAGDAKPGAGASKGGSTPSRLERVSPTPAISNISALPSWLGGTPAQQTGSTAGRSPSPQPASSADCQCTSGAAADPCIAMLAKKCAGVDSNSEPATPRTMRGAGAAASANHFTIPAHQPGDAVDDEALTSDVLMQRSKSETVGPATAGTAATAATTQGGLREVLSRHSASTGKAAATAVAAALPGSTPTLSPSQSKKRSGAAPCASGSSSSDLSRRLRSMLAPGSREVSRMGWAPLRPSVSSMTSSTGEDDAVGAVAVTADAALGAAAPRVLGGDAFGSGWKGPGGKRYLRTLESHLALTAANIEIAVSLRLVSLPASPAAPEVVTVAAEGEARVLDDEDDDEDVPDAVPLEPPPVLSIPLVNTPVNLGVNSLYALLYGAGSTFMADFWASEDLRDVSATPWEMGDTAVASPGVTPSPLRTRKVTYVKPLRIPIPLAPKQCHVWEDQRLVAKSDGGWVVECKSTNDAPKGDCFYVLVQLCGVHRASGQSQLRISMEMVFHKQCIGKGMIQHGAESDARRSWAAFVSALQRHIAATGPAPALTAVPAGPAALPAAPDAPTGSFLPAAGVARGAGVLALPRLSALVGGGVADAVGVFLGVVKLLLLAGLVLAVLHAGSSVSFELRELTAAIREAGRARCDLGSMGAAGQGLGAAIARGAGGMP